MLGQVEGLLEQIPALFSQQQVVDACLGGAVEACIQLLKSHTGGKLHVFASILPKVPSSSCDDGTSRA